MLPATAPLLGSVALIGHPVQQQPYSRVDKTARGLRADFCFSFWGWYALWDFQKAFDYARGYLPGDAVQKLEAVLRDLGQRTDGMGADELHGKFVRLSEARRRICFQLNENGGLGCDDSKISATRELLLLDFVLEQQQGLLLQSGAEFNVTQLALHLRELLLCLSAHDPCNVELT